jgi:hypothetical protein
MGGPVSIDFSFLNGYYAARSAARTSAPASLVSRDPQPSALRQPLPTGVTPPWERAERTGKGAETAKLRSALETKSFVNEDDSTLNRAGISRDQRKLFALYKGLQALQTLAARAGEEKTLAGERSGLARRFAAGFEEVRAAVAKGGFEDLTLLLGDKSNEAKTQFAVPRQRFEYKGNIVSNGASDTALAGVTGTETITVNVMKGTTPTPVTLNLSEISGTISINSVIVALNDKMAEAGLMTRFKRLEELGQKEDSPKRYGIMIQGVASERVSLSASGAEPSLTLVGNNGSGEAQRGQVTKLTGLGGALPTSVASEKIEPKDGVSDARATATDGDGNTFVVGTVTGDLEAGLVQGNQDVYLRKYDSANNLVWSRLLGSADRADGFALAVDGDGNPVVAGRVRDRLTAAASGGNGDSFVTKYDSNGIEVFTRQAGSAQEDQATALAVDSSGNIFVGGWTRGRMTSGQAAATGTDAYIQKLSATGSALFTRQFGSGADERIAGLAMASDGSLIASSVENGQAMVRKFSPTDPLEAAAWEVNLGGLNSGSLGGLAARDGAVYVSGTTQNAALDAGGTASVVTAHSGGSDAFVFRLDDAGASATANFVTYAGSAGADGGAGLTVTADAVYLAGSTRQGLPGQNTVEEGKAQGFVQKLSLSGASQWTYQYAGAGGHATATAVAVDDSGGSVLDALGLPRGEVSMGGSRLITAQSTVRAGDFFTLQINDSAARKIEVRAGDTMRGLAQRINRVLGLKGEATVARDGAGDSIRIKVNDDSTVTLKAGTGGQNALTGLGMQPGTLYGKDAKAIATDEDDLKTINSFAMRLDRDLDLSTDRKARMAAASINGAMEAIKQASRRLIEGPPPPEPKARREDGPVPASIRSQLAGYQTALMAFGGGQTGGGSFGQF